MSSTDLSATSVVSARRSLVKLEPPTAHLQLMTNQFSKRKYAGPTVAELRKVDQIPLRVPPHKKPKVWTLTVQWTETTTRQMTKQFTSRAARDESRARVERHFREEAEKAKQPKRYR